MGVVLGMIGLFVVLTLMFSLNLSEEGFYWIDVFFGQCKQIGLEINFAIFGNGFYIIVKKPIGLCFHHCHPVPSKLAYYQRLAYGFMKEK